MVKDMSGMVLDGCKTPLSAIGIKRLDKNGPAPIVYKHPAFLAHIRDCKPCNVRLNFWLGRQIDHDREGPAECVT